MLGEKKLISTTTAIMVTGICLVLLVVGYIFINSDDIFGFSKQQMHEIISKQETAIDALTKANNELLETIKHNDKMHKEDIIALTHHFQSVQEEQQKALDVERSRIESLSKLSNKQVVYVKDKRTKIDTSSIKNDDIVKISIIQIESIWTTYYEVK